MDFEDTPEEAAFRAEVNAWLAGRAKPRRINDERNLTELANGASAEMEAARAWQKKKAEKGYARITWPKGMGGIAGTQMQAIIFAFRHLRNSIKKQKSLSIADRD